MRARLLLALALTACAIAAPPQQQKAPATAVAAPNLTGSWSWSQGEESLDLVLKQEDGKITGYHNAVGQRGMKVDEVAEDSGEPSIKGEVKGSVATVTFRSGFPDATGHGTATLTLRGGFLYWRIVESKGEHYLPLKARLAPLKRK
jgi:hypothetical protein